MSETTHLLLRPDHLILTGILLACCAVLARALTRRRAILRDHWCENLRWCENPLSHPSASRWCENPFSHPPPRESLPASDSTPPPSPAPSRAIPRAALALVLLLVAAFLFWRGNDPLGVRMDSYSDANVLVSGRQYARDGLFNHYGAPQHQVTGPTNPPDPFYFYTKYPAASNLIHGILRRIGCTSHRALRAPAALCTLLGLCLWFGVFRRHVAEPIAALATAIMATAFLTLAYADSLHFHAYGFAGIAASVYCFIRAAAPAERRRATWLLACGLCLLITSFFTWEYHLWFVLFAVGYRWLFPSPLRWRWLPLLAIPFILGAAASAAQRRLAEPGVAESQETTARQGEGLLDVVYRRTIGFDTSLDTPQSLTLSGYPAHMLWRIFAFYGIPAPALLVFLAMLLLVARTRRPHAPQEAPTPPDSTPASQPGVAATGPVRHGVRLLLVLAIAGIAWWCVMMQHSSVHPHVLRHFLPAYALLLALTGGLCWTLAGDSAHAPLIRAAAILLAAVLACAHLEGAWCNVRMHTREDFLASRGRNDPQAAAAGRYARLSALIPPGGVALTNLQQLPLMRAAMDRPVYFASAFKLPRNDPQHGRWLIELVFNHLRELYADELPPLYYIYHVTHPTLEEAFRRNHQFRYLLLGTTDSADALWPRARQALNEAQQTGASRRSFCPIVGLVDRMIIFDMTPAIPALRSEFSPRGFPTREQFGPIP